MNDKIKFNDLSNWLKAFVIAGWILICFNAFAFLIGLLIASS